MEIEDGGKNHNNSKILSSQMRENGKSIHKTADLF